MQPAALMYHDVTDSPRDSGFPSDHAAVYKLSRQAFEEHLDAIRAAAPETVLTFDDGGASFHSCIAGMLEKRGWRGHFFITTDWIGKPGFCDRDQIRELAARGHTIGSHSCSHPPRMSSLAPAELEAEWRRSRVVLEDIIGGPVTTASVPGGYYSQEVARAAARAGIRTLFTSEPTAHEAKIDGCLILGRYAIQRDDPASRAAALAAGRGISRMQQSAWWQVKKIAKRLGGEAYVKVRQRVLRG